MKKKEAWSIDIQKELKKYGCYDQKIGYPDSRFYRKEKERISLRDNGRGYETQTK